MVKGVSARRHAQAVFQIALENDNLETWQADLEMISDALRNPQLASLLENPKIRFSEKEKLLQNILTDINPVAMNLVRFLVVKNRIRIIDDLVTEYKRLMNAKYGMETAEVITAIPLSDKEKKQVQEKLETITKKKVVVTTQVDPNIVGGVVAKTGDQLIDGSVRTRLKELRKSLVEAGLEVK